MAVHRLYNDRHQFFDSSGNPAASYRMFFYRAGTTTKQNTYNSSGGTTPNANPITLDAGGYFPGEVWLTQGSEYKLVLAPLGTDDPPTSTTWSEDEVSGINDRSSSEEDQWQAGPSPTYVSASNFTMAGDQTSIFTLKRRLKTTNSGGTKYGTVVAVSYSAGTQLTTVVMQVDASGSLDSGLSEVFYGVLSATNDSIPRILWPAGVIVPYAAAAAPSYPTSLSWLFCDGQAYSRSTYAVLFEAISTTYGAGDGSTTFNIPDLRGRAPFGHDNMNSVGAANRITSGGSGINGASLGQAGGSQSLTGHTHSFSATTSSDGAHAHDMNNLPAFPGGTSPNLDTNSGTAPNAGGYQTSTAPAHTHTVSGTSGSTGAGSSQNMPPTLIVNYLISTGR